MNNILFQHKVVKDNRITLAAKKDEETNNLNVSISICSNSEQFRKEKGRTIASGRLNKGVKTILLPIGEDNPSYVLNTFSKELTTQTIKSIKHSFGL